MELLSFFIFLVLALALAGVLILISRLVSKKSNIIKNSLEFESGSVPNLTNSGRYFIQFYVTALFFLPITALGLLLFPWILMEEIGGQGKLLLTEFIIFISIFALSYLYIKISNDLKWKQ